VTDRAAVFVVATDHSSAVGHADTVDYASHVTRAGNVYVGSGESMQAGAMGRLGLGSSAAATLLGLLAGFDPPPALEGLVVRTRRARWVTLIGPAGSGKSTMLTGLAVPARTVGRVPGGFVHAIAYADHTTNAVSLAHELAAQVAETVPGYADAAVEHRRTSADWNGQDVFGREVAGPLGRLRTGVIRLIVDGVDQLETDSAEEVRKVLQRVLQDPALEHVHLVVSSRVAADWMPPSAVTMSVPVPDPHTLSQYLQGQRVAPEAADLLADLCARGDSAWLLARLIADTHHDLNEVDRDQLSPRLAAAAGRPKAMSMLYDRLLHAAGADDADTWAGQLRPVLTPLTAAGPNPVLPLDLLAAVSGQFGGPTDLPAIHGILLGLGRLVVRSEAGSDRELVGLFHPTLIDHLTHGNLRVDVTQGRRMLLEEVDKLAPITGLYMDNPVYRWAAEANAQHYWELGMIDAALQSLRSRPLPTPQENLHRWTTWRGRVANRRGPEHKDSLSVRHNIAYWTGEAGNGAEALRLFRELLCDRERLLAPGDPDILATRCNIAAWTGYTESAAEALRLYREVLPDQERVLGPLDPDTLITRNNTAHWSGQAGNGAEALRLFRELLPDQERVLGPLHPDTLITRNNIAAWTAKAGNGAEALRLFRELLPDRERVLGPLHFSTLATRGHIAGWTAEMGNRSEALRLFRELLNDQERVLGPLHPDTLITRNNIGLLDPEIKIAEPWF